MTRTRFVGQLSRHTALRKRQMAFLRVLVECSGSRSQAIEVSGTPRGSVFRWQSDPWFRVRYQEVRATLTRDAEALRDQLAATAMAMALGRYRGLLKPAAVRQIVDGLDEETGRAEHAELDRQIAELLGG